MNDLEKPPEGANVPSAQAESDPRYPSTTSFHTDAEYEILDWSGNDGQLHPSRWSRSRKWIIAGAAMFGSLIIPLNGTSITVARQAIDAEFGIDDSYFPNSYWAVTSWSLGGALFILVGLPLMEDLGVRVGYNIFYAVFFLMIIPQAVAQNYATLIVTRFFTGGCVALLANTIASIIPDLWPDNRARSLPIALYIVLYVTGNSLGPPVFAGVVEYTGNWRWIFYIQLILYGATFPVFALLIKETRADVLLRRRARSLRHRTHKPIFTRTELTAAPFLPALWRSVSRPVYLFFTEPVLFAAGLWSAFSFGTVFLFTQSVEQVFTTVYGWSAAQTAYVQLAVVAGEIVGFVASLGVGARLFRASARRNPERPGCPIPEARLYVSVVGSFLGLSGGMFVYAWTARPAPSAPAPWIAPALGLALVGAGIQIVVTAAADYVVDAYAESDYAGSAISAVAAVENIVAGLLPLSAQRMYTNLGFEWASTLLALLAFGLSFAPVVFIWKGRWFRERSPFMQAGSQLRQGQGPGEEK